VTPSLDICALFSNFFISLTSPSIRRTLQALAGQGALTPVQRAELGQALVEVRELVAARRTHSDDGARGLLEALQAMQAAAQRRAGAARMAGAVGVHGHACVSLSEDFQQTVQMLQRAAQDPKYLEKRQPKINKLKEILAEHFARHAKAGSSTRALVFSQLRSTVHEIKTEIGEVEGESPALCFYALCFYRRYLLSAIL
jgi:hypothetical protein